jgi:Peptidase family M23
MTMRHSLFAFACAIVLLGTLHGQGSALPVEGTWQGTLVAGPSQLRLVLNISKTADGIYLGTLISVDQGGARIPIDRIDVTGDTVHLELKAVGGTFEGSMNADRSQLKGTWTQLNRPSPLEFTRTAAPLEPDRQAAATTPPPVSPFGIPAEMTIPMPPMPFPSGGKMHLVYELHITNFAGIELPLQRLEVLGENGTLASFEGAELNALLMRAGLPPADDRRTIGPGQRAIAYLWITIDSGKPLPRVLRHRITGRQSLEGGVVSVSTMKPIVLGPPLHGSDWMAANGPDNGSIHRRALLPLDGKPQIAQRFAIDWVQRGADGKTFTGDQKDNKSYKAYGNDVLAVADAVVASIKEGVPENVPGLALRAVPITLETVGGNNVILDLGGGRFAFYAHMQPGSIRVKPGDRVRRGQVVGLVGNSGNSTEPHLHFHVANASAALASEGLPYVMESFDLQSDAGAWEPRRNELPLQNSRVQFR